MTYFAEIDSNSMVINVIVAEQDFIDSEVLGKKENFVKTDVNTFEGTHTKDGTALRKNFAAIGYKYDKVTDAFIPPKPHTSWEFNTEKAVYEAPVKYPTDGKPYDWDEDSKTWKVIKNTTLIS